MPVCLQEETRRFNATYARRDEATPLPDFLLLAAAQARGVYSRAYAELARQVWWQRGGKREARHLGWICERCFGWPKRGPQWGQPGPALALPLALLPAALQVTRHCEERGRLMADVWVGYVAMVDR